MEENNFFMRGSGLGRFIVAIILILVLGGVAIVSIIRDRIVNYPQYSVSVVGQGKVAYQPDLAIITLGVQIDKAPKAEDALNQLNDRIKNIINAIKIAGVASEDISTQNYYLNPQYDYKDNVSVVSGYNANQQITIKIRNLLTNPDQISKVLAEASKAGANQVLGVSFDVSNLEDLKHEARLKAISDADKKAVSISSAAGVVLGEKIGWWENIVQAPGVNYGYYDYGKGGMGAGGSSPIVPSGSQEVVVEVNLSYKLK